MDKYSTALVYWFDAHDDATAAWVSLEELEPEPYRVATVGILLPAETKKGHVSVARSIGDGVVDSVIHIPSAMVESVEILGIVELD
jgi:hypothetical protein